MEATPKERVLESLKTVESWGGVMPKNARLSLRQFRYSGSGDIVWWNNAIRIIEDKFIQYGPNEAELPATIYFTDGTEANGTGHDFIEHVIVTKL